MIVGTVVFDLHLPGINSLKEKRRIIKSLMTKLKNRYNISIAEVGLNDTHRSAQIGISMVGNDSRFVDKALSSVINEIVSSPLYNVVDYRVEML